MTAPAEATRRVRWLRAGLWILAFAGLWLPVLDDPPLRTGAFVQDVRNDRAVVAMVTAGVEQLSLELTDADGKPLPDRPAVTAEATPRRRHAFALAGLEPSRSYSYRVLDERGAERDRGTVRTPPAADAEKVRFAVVGDSGGQPWWTWLQRSPLWHLPARWELLPTADAVTRIGARIAAADPDFVLHVGDIVYPWGHQGHYAAGFFRPFGSALRRTPFFVALGNHDVLDDGGRQALANFVLPRGDVTGDERCYSFAWGAVRVTVLDLGLADPSLDRLGPGHPSREFLARVLAQAAEPWQVVVSHYPMRSASRQMDRADLLAELAPLLEQYGVDLYLSGHDHTYQRFGQPGELVEVVSGGGGKSLYPVRADRRVKVALSQYHWCAVEVAGRRLTLRAHGIDGDLLDTVTLTRGGAGDPRMERIRLACPPRASRIDALP